MKNIILHEGRLVRKLPYHVPPGYVEVVLCYQELYWWERLLFTVCRKWGRA